jgi:hypothetical protein
MVSMRFKLVSDARGAIAKVAAVGVFVAVPGTAFALPANADPANPDNPANPMNPLNPASPDRI